MSEFIRVPRALKKRSRRSVLATTSTVHSPLQQADSAIGVDVPLEMGRKSVKEKEKKSFKRGSIKERWLLTRKTWKFMADAGRRLLPEGVSNKAEDISKIEQYFQEVCRNEPRFLVWRRKCSYPGASRPLPRRRWKRGFGAVSPKKASSADEAEDDYNDSLEQAQYQQLMIDMLKNYLNITDDDDVHDQREGGSSVGRGRYTPVSTTTTSSSASQDPVAKSTTAATTRAPTITGRDYKSGHSSRSSQGSTAPCDDRKPTGSALSSRSSPRSGDASFSLFSSLRDSAPAHLLANMKRMGRGSGSSLMDHITQEMLNDKVALRKLYNELRDAQRFNRSSMYRIPNPKPHYQRSALGLHKTFIFPELTGKSRGNFGGKTLDVGCSSSSSTSSLLLKHRDRSAPSSSLYGINERLSDEQPPTRPERKIVFHTQSIQTSGISIDVLNEISADYKKQVQLEEHEAIMRGEELANLEMDSSAAGVKSNDRRNSEDISQSVSDTIKRYLRMARKKPPKDDVNRFKRINYDQNLRNIKAKGETTKIGDDDGNCKGCQTDEDWIVKTPFAVLARDLSPIATTLAVRPTTLPRPKSSSAKQQDSNVTTPVSSPSSPGISSNIFHTSTQFLSNLFGHTQTATASSATTPNEGSSNDSIYCSPDVAMQKSKSSSNVGNIVSRKIWKSRSKSQSRPEIAVKSQWVPHGNCVWSSSQGHTIKLKETALNELTEVERKILYQLAIGKINQFNLGVNTDFLQDSITSRPATHKPTKRKALLLKRKALTTGFFDSNKDDDVKGSPARSRIFGVALEERIESELKERQSNRPETTKQDRRARNSLSSLDPTPATYRVSGSCESLPSKSQQLSESDLLKGSLSQFDVRRSSRSGGGGEGGDDEDDVQLEGLERPVRPQVPSVIVSCVEHLEKNGLHTVGIFRKSTSKMRVRQLREDFDLGTSVQLGDEVCPHDVATLLKEYLRELPEPLLCRRLYQPFVNTQRIRNRRLQLEAISHLVQVLPVSHRDTLHYLLKFLAKVARYADDVKSTGGEVISEGNKMDTNNLATVFAPNILHRAVAGQVTTGQEVEERLDVINVVRIMIDHYEEMYHISAETIDEIYLNMIDSHPAQLDVLCDRVDYQLAKGQESSHQSPTSPPPRTTAELLEANKQKRNLFLHNPGGHPKPMRRQHRDSGSHHDTRSASIDSDVFDGGSRRLSSSNVLTASLKIPVQIGDDIPYIEDEREYSSSSASGSRRGTAAHVMHIDSRKSSSSGTITGTLSLLQSPSSLTMSPATSNSTSPDYYRAGTGQVFFGDDDFNERLLENQGKARPPGGLGDKPSSELRKSSSLTAATGTAKKLFDKLPAKQKLSIHPTSIMSPGGGGGGSGSSEHKMAITNIGGDLLRSKTADFERFLGAQNKGMQQPRTYKRKEIISSAHNSKK